MKKLLILFLIFKLNLLSEPEPMLAPEKPKLKIFTGVSVLFNNLNFTNNDNVWDGTYNSNENIFGANFKFKKYHPFWNFNSFANISMFQRNFKVPDSKILVDPIYPPDKFLQRTNELTTFALLDFGLGWEIIKSYKFRLDLKGGFYYSFMIDREYKSNDKIFEYDNNNKSISDFGITLGTNLTYDISSKFKLDFEYNYLFRLNGNKNNAPPFNYWQNGHSFKIGFLYGMR